MESQQNMCILGLLAVKHAIYSVGREQAFASKVLSIRLYFTTTLTVTSHESNVFSMPVALYPLRSTDQPGMSHVNPGSSKTCLWGKYKCCAQVTSLPKWWWNEVYDLSMLTSILIRLVGLTSHVVSKFVISQFDFSVLPPSDAQGTLIIESEM